MKVIYQGRPSDSFDKDKPFLVDIFINYLPDDVKETWSRRVSVYGIKGLRGPELDLQKKCTISYGASILRNAFYSEFKSRPRDPLSLFLQL